MGLKQKVLRMFPFLYRVRVVQLIWKRRLLQASTRVRFARSKSSEALSFVQMKHKSILRRVLGNSDPVLQENKIVNLGIALRHVNGVTIHPGETFSFWDLIGKPTQAKGYIDGLMLSYGEVRVGTGGGLCQLANMLFWLALHSPLKIKERHHHSFDIFPDDRRVIPFGTGTSVFYNYIDLQFYNPTDTTFQFNLALSGEFLEGTLCSDKELPFRYKVDEKNHQFYEKEGKWFRGNEIWRQERYAGDDRLVREELIIVNHAEVKYQRVPSLESVT